MKDIKPTSPGSHSPSGNAGSSGYSRDINNEVLVSPKGDVWELSNGKLPAKVSLEISGLAEKMRQFIDNTDWEGLARAWHKEDIKWHANEWKEFIGGIIKVAEERVRAKICAELNHEQQKFLDGFGHPKDCKICLSSK